MPIPNDLNQEDTSQPSGSTDPVTIKDSWFWIRGSSGNASVTTTFATIAFVVTTLSYLLSMIQSIGPLSFRAFDTGACASYLVPIMGLYFGRRYTEAKFN